MNISTTDAIVHGQVKQSSNFAFARIYESGHEVPFYQPLAALELLERAICGEDIATGKQSWHGYKTVGPAESTYREGNATVQLEDVDPSATYNTTLNEPNPVSNSSSSSRFRLGKRSSSGSIKLSSAEKKHKASKRNVWNSQKQKLAAKKSWA